MGKKYVEKGKFDVIYDHMIQKSNVTLVAI
jgi:hypothetical protein